MLVCLAIAFLSGALIPVQTAANARMRAVVGSASVSTLVSFAVSSLSLVAVSLAIGIGIGQLSRPAVGIGSCELAGENVVDGW